MRIHSFICTVYSIDASKPDDGILRYANDQWNKPNAKIEKRVYGGVPHLILKAIREITPQDEIGLTYDYGNDDAEWRKQVCTLKYAVNIPQGNACSND